MTRRYGGGCGGGDGDVRGRGGCSAVPGGVDVVVAGILSRRRGGLGLMRVAVVVVPSRRCLDDTLIAKRQVTTKGRREGGRGIGQQDQEWLQ